MERSQKRLAGLLGRALANDPALRQITLREVDQLALRGPEGPHVAAGRDDDALHQPETAAERDALRRRQRLAVLVEHRDRMAAISGEPGVVVGVDGGAERAPLHSAAGKAGRDRRERFAVGGELGGVALPQRVLPLPADREIVADPEVALAVEHGLATRAISTPVELERQDPGAGRPDQVWHERHRPHVRRLRLAVHLDRRNRIELVEQGEQPPGLVPGIAGDRLGRRQRVGRRAAFGRRGGREQPGAGILHHARGATGQHVRQRGEVGHRRRLAAVERPLDGLAPPASREIDKIGHVPGGDAQAERVTLDGRAVEELRVRPRPRLSS